ncbi:hypothetical protein ON010_g5819 [Phytophthora cinnamomi]|nr:hypothetical protein ON010_g5819 [Phytophthora cinnamomi]
MPPSSIQGESTTLTQAPNDLHEQESFKSSGRSLPQLEIRFKNLTLGVDMVEIDEAVDTELPTIKNYVKKRYGGCCTKKTVVRRQILKGISGVFKPGTMTLVLGQPGSGKSALMKVLSGRFPMDKNVVLEGEVTYNGTPRDELLQRLPQFVSYVAQTDTHFPTLSVRETLEFAHTFSGDTSTNSTDTVTRTGLDSAATLDIISTQRSIAKNLHKTVVISLLQPSPEVFALFDDVLLLNDGEVLYHGPRERVVDYFKGLGFVCPPHRDVADFLVDLSTEKQYKYQESIRGRTHPRQLAEFSEAFARSGIHIARMTELYMPQAASNVRDVDDYLKPMPEFHLSFWAETMTLMRRQLILTVRNKAFLRGKAVLLVLMGLLYSSVFYQLNFEDVQVVMGIIFYSIMYLALVQTPMLPVYFAARDVFYKQRRANFYRTASYVVSVSVSQIPLTLVESIVFGTFVYWMGGFVQTVGAYILFEVLLFLTNLAFSAFFFYISCVTVDVHVAKPLAMVSLLIAILFSGFVVTRTQLPDWFIWVYWVDPISWGASQSRSGTNYCTEYGMNMGEYYLNFYDIQTERSWIAYGVVFNLVTYFLFMFLAYRALEYKRIETPSNLVASKPTSTANYIELATPRALDDRKQLSTRGEILLSVPDRDKDFEPVTVAFQDLWYTVLDPRNKNESVDLLKGVSGFALPGKMTALMGATGAGKTTLMDVIAGRKTGGKARGRILLNGFPASDLAIRRCTGYCEQMDIHADSATIREALTFSAFLRRGSDVSYEKKYDSVVECLELLELDSIADRYVRGCSVEQLKRLTIGVELAAQPSLLFLDEPTNGLDARAAKVIMDGVRKVANTGRTILCTIHQPSTEVSMLFDSLLLLKKGGETVFFGDVGDRCHDLVAYFESIPQVPKIPVGYNPATWMLECSIPAASRPSWRRT